MPFQIPGGESPFSAILIAGDDIFVDIATKPNQNPARNDSSNYVGDLAGWNIYKNGSKVGKLESGKQKTGDTGWQEKDTERWNNGLME